MNQYYVSYATTTPDGSLTIGSCNVSIGKIPRSPGDMVLLHKTIQDHCKLESVVVISMTPLF